MKMKMLLQFNLFFLACCFQLADFAKYNLDDAVREDLENIFKKSPLTVREIQTQPVTAEKIKYYLYTKDNPVNYTVIDPANPKISPDVPIVFILHGFLDTATGDIAKDLKDAFLARDHRYHVILVDYDIYADQILYLVAVDDVPAVGLIVAKFIVKLHTDFSIPLLNIMVVGHSLGGQTAAYIGKGVQQLLQKKLPLIVGLDPAGPEFVGKPSTQRLNRDDATIVIVIHTNGDGLGHYLPCGTIDYYPNGGKFQPGCLEIFLTNATDFVANTMCSHVRVVYLFVVALTNSGAFRSRECTSWRKYQISPNSCPNTFEFIGNLNTTKTGTYYLKTGSSPPY